MTQRNTRLFGSLVVIAALGGAGLFATSKATAEAPRPAAAIGSPAPNFELKDQNGNTVTLDQYKDKVVVLEWFNDGCPFVQKQYTTGAMNTTASTYAAKDVVWLAINSTSSADVSHNKKVAGDWKMDRPVLDDSNGTVGHLYGAKTTPNMYVINKGVLVYEGAIDDKPTPEASDLVGSTNYVAKALDEVLAGKPVTTAVTKPYGCGVKYKN